MTRLHLRLLLAMLTIGLAGVGPAAAQPVPCDQGVIRLPDRTGTVQICSAFAAQVPALSKQLGEAVKLLGNQQQQIRELTRLVSALNGSSAGLDASRQTQLLRSLSAELTRAEQRGPAASRRTIEELSEQFEGLRDQLVQALSQPASLAATNEALRGRLGDSIAQLETRSATRQLDEIGQRMKQVQADIGTVKDGVAQANSKLDSLAAAVESAKSADGCTDLECAIFGNATVATVQRLVDKDVRLAGLPGMNGQLVMSILARQPADREALLRLMLRADLDPQVNLSPRTENGRLISARAKQLADQVMQRTGDARPDISPSSASTGNGNWNKLASCLDVDNKGVSVSELAALLGDSELMKQARRLGFSPPRPELLCRSWGRRDVLVTVAIDSDGRASVLDPTNPADRCPDLACAVERNASVVHVQRLVSHGVRVTGHANLDAELVLALLLRQAAEREAMLVLLKRAGLDPHIKLKQWSIDRRLISAHAMQLTSEVMQRIGLPSSEGWTTLARCLAEGNEGVSFSELAALLGDSQLMNQFRRLGFSPPRPELTCPAPSYTRRGPATVLIDPSGSAKLKGS